MLTITPRFSLPFEASSLGPIKLSVTVPLRAGVKPIASDANPCA